MKILNRSGFTLVEILLVVAIMVTLAGISIAAINPQKNQIEATDALRLKSIKTIKEAIDSYEIGNFTKPYTTNVQREQYYDICATGRTGTCIDLSTLVTTGYLARIPEDPATKSGAGFNDTTNFGSLVDISGYCLRENTNGILEITAAFLGIDPDNKQTESTCDDLNISSCNVDATLQAEDVTLNGVTVETNHAGYTGTGFGDYTATIGDYIQWEDYAISNTGTYRLTFRYANGSVSNRPVALKINGTTEVATLNFPVTTAWDTWSTVSQDVTLTTLSDIRLESTVGNGPNIDYLLIEDLSCTSSSSSSSSSISAYFSSVYELS